MSNRIHDLLYRLNELGPITIQLSGGHTMTVTGNGYAHFGYGKTYEEMLEDAYLSIKSWTMAQEFLKTAKVVIE